MFCFFDFAKSSVIRALHGLWRKGGGFISRLPNSQVLFLPQKPYLPSVAEEDNTLSTQLLFPTVSANKDRIPFPLLKHTLQKLNLIHILEYDINNK